MTEYLFGDESKRDCGKNEITNIVNNDNDDDDDHHHSVNEEKKSSFKIRNIGHQTITKIAGNRIISEEEEEQYSHYKSTNSQLHHRNIPKNCVDLSSSLHHFFSFHSLFHLPFRYFQQNNDNRDRCDDNDDQLCNLRFGDDDDDDDEEDDDGNGGLFRFFGVKNK